MDVFYRIIALFGGLALFLYGMRIMGDGLKSSSGSVMRTVLERVTGNPVIGFLFGVLVTCMIQSSTATIVLTVGLVGAGFLKFRQSVGIILGANVGTAITAQIIRLMDLNAGSGSLLYFFKSDNLAPLALIVGMVLIMFVKGRSGSTTGTVFMGFGILFVGLMNMSSAVATMSDSLSRLLVSFEDNYLLGFLAGAGVTGIIQSSSAVVGILQSIASSVGVTFCGVFAVIIGVNIGDCLTTYLVCRIGARREQIRACVVHILYNVCAATLLFVGIFVLRKTGILGSEIWNATLRSGGVANVHGIFRLIPAVLLLPFSGALASMAERLVPDQKEDPEHADIEQSLRELDSRLLLNPGMALAQSECVLENMAEAALKNYRAATGVIFTPEEVIFTRINEREKLLDRMTDSASQFLLDLSPRITLDSDLRNQSYQLKVFSCFERIGDLAVNIAGNARHLYEGGLTLSERATRELRVAASAVEDVLSLTSDACNEDDPTIARRIEPLEEVIDELIEHLRDQHVQRMTGGERNIPVGIEYQDILLHLERISDQCSDIAVYLLGRNDTAISGHEHQYIHDLHHTESAAYANEFETARKKYFEAL